MWNLFYDWKVILSICISLTLRLFYITLGVIVLMFVINYLQFGQEGFKKYLNELNIKGYVIVSATPMIIVQPLVLIINAMKRYFIADRYCKENHILIREFFKRPKVDILKVI